MSAFEVDASKVYVDQSTWGAEHSLGNEGSFSVVVIVYIYCLSIDNIEYGAILCQTAKYWESS